MKSIYKFIPYEKLTWQTNLQIEKILGRLEANVEEKEFDIFLMMNGSHRKTNKEFQGEFSENGFLIMGFTSGPDQATPMIHGHLKKTMYGHTIDLTIRFGTIANILFGLGIVLTLTFFFSNISTIFTPNPAYISLIAPIVFYGILLLSFKKMSKKHRQFLMEMFEASEANG